MGKRRKWLSMLLALAVTATTPAFTWLEVSADTGTATELTDGEIDNLLASTSKTRTSVHDPSIVKDPLLGLYYVFGSHMGVSKTDDLMNWTSVTGQTSDSTLFGKMEGGEVVQASYDEAFLKCADESDGKDYDIADWISGIDIDDQGNEVPHTIYGNMWAPDVIYNESMGKWCMYMSLNGSTWNSAIALLTADEIDGPYVYEGPVVFSGFSTTDSDKSYKKTDLEKALGTTYDELPDQYNHISDKTWGDYLPHAIDPAVFYDEDGSLWMVYGSWSGGIYTLQLDEDTGLRDYDVTYDSVGSGKNITSDPYFGTKIAGGYYVSGEGPYIQYINGYYYLFVSYGFYSPEGGYNMRIFRSETPDGSYVDCDGTSAIFNLYQHNYKFESNARGLKLMGNYKWDTMSVAEVAQGHNSVLVDDDGKMYVVYHTKFADGTASHEVRVHELFMNEDGWPVAAPYEYDSSITIDGTNYAAEEVAGEYDVIVHDMEIDYENLAYKTPVSLTLNADGTVSGAYTGTWEQGTGSNSATLTLDGTTYKGVFVEQIIDGTKVKTMCFTIVNEDGVCVWGSKDPGDSYAIAQSTKNVVMPQIAFSDLTLLTEGISGVSISWSSDNTAIISDSGEVTLPANDTTVNMTATYSKGDYVYNKVYPIKVYAEAQNDEESTLIASYFVDEKVDLSDKLDGSLYVANPYSKNVTPGVDVSGGITMTFDIEGNDSVNVLGAIFAFTGGGKLYFSPGSYFGYNATGGWFDANLNDYKLVEDYIGTAATVSICITPEGFSVSVNDAVVYTQEIRDTENGGGILEDYYDCLTWLNETADKLYFGYGSWWNAVGENEANCTISNVYCYANPIDLSKKAVDEITYTKEEVVLAADDSIFYEDNPFYKKNIQTIEMEYTINLTSEAMKNGWDGLFSFYNSETGARVSIQTAPYICYNNMSGSYMDINQPGLGGENAIVDCEPGEDHTFVLRLTSEGATMTMDGTPIEIGVNAVGATYADVIKCITKCDQLTWGTGVNGNGGETGFWNSELCTLSNIRLESGADPVEVEEIVYDEITLTKDIVKLTSNSDIEYIDNPFYGKTIEDLSVKYTINVAANAAKNGWDGIFSFYNSATGGRISFQTAPYICFNGGGSWMDINRAETADGAVLVNNAIKDKCEKGKDYTFELHFTDSELTVTLDGEPVEITAVNKSSSSVTYKNLISYITKCDKLTWGVGNAVTAYWGTEICILTDIAIWSGTYKPILATGVTLDASAVTLVKGEGKTLKATVEPSNAGNKAVEWTSTDKTVATVSSTGEIKALKAGKTTITTTAKDGSKESASCTVTVVNPTVTLSKKTLSMIVGNTSTELKATGLQKNDSVTGYKSSKENVVMVDNNGKLTARAAGTSTITVTTKYGATATCTVTVIKPTVSLNVKSLKLQVKRNTSVLKASGLATGDSIKSYKSSNTSVVTVNSSSGKLTAKNKTGTATITVTTKYGATATCRVTVQKGAVTTKSIKTDKANYTVNKGKKTSIVVTLNPINSTNKITYTSSDKKIATVTKSGVIRGVKKGTCTITIKSGKITKKVRVTVK